MQSQHRWAGCSINVKLMRLSQGEQTNRGKVTHSRRFISASVIVISIIRESPESEREETDSKNVRTITWGGTWWSVRAPWQDKLTARAQLLTDWLSRSPASDGVKTIGSISLGRRRPKDGFLERDSGVVECVLTRRKEVKLSSSRWGILGRQEVAKQGREKSPISARKYLSEYHANANTFISD